MGIIKQGILGGFSGKVAGVVGTSWKGRAVIKARPLSVANPKTEGQVSQRTSFKSVAQVGSSILTSVLRPLYNPIAGNISGYNKFTSKNKQMFSGVGSFQFADTNIGGGTLQHDQLNSITTADSGATIDVAWTVPAGTPAARLTDKAVAFVIEPISGNIWSIAVGDTREEELMNLTKFKAGSDLTAQLQVYGYIGYVDTTGRLTSIESAGFEATVDFT